MVKQRPKTTAWKRSQLVTALGKAGWNFWFRHEKSSGQLWGSYSILEPSINPFKIRLHDDRWILFEDLSTGLVEIKSKIYSRRQSQEIKRAIIKVKNRRVKSG